MLLPAFAAAPGFAQESHALPPGVIARQGGVDVTMDDIEAYAQKIPKADRTGFFDSPKRIESTIMTLLLQKQLAAEARRDKLDADPGVQKQIAQSTDDTLARVDLDNYRKNLKLPDFAPLANEYYLTHKSEFEKPAAVKVKHVLVSIKDRSEVDAKVRIGEVEAAAVAHPEQFDDLVEKYSDDPSRTLNHGQIDDAASGRMVPPFAKAADALKTPGEISPIVKTEFGFHVLKLVSREPPTSISFDEVKDRLVMKLRDEYIEREAAAHSGQMRGNKLEANPDLVAEVRTHFLPPGAKLPSEIAEEANDEAMKKAAEERKAKGDKPAQ